MKRISMYAAIIAVLLFSCNNKSNQQLGINEKDKIEFKQEEKKLKYKQEANKPSFANANYVASDSASIVNISSAPLGKQEPTSKKDVLNSGTPITADWDKKIIKTANITLELQDYAAYNKTIHQSLKGYAAYIAQESQTENNGQIENTIAIKVPVDKFEDLVNSFSGTGIKLLEKRITTEDVTGEVIDNKGRIEAKKQIRARYIELLKQAKNMEDILQVQNEINNITEQLESSTSRVDYLVHQSAYSTINLRYYQYTNGTKPLDESPSFFWKIKEAFKLGGSFIGNLLLVLVSIWPLLLAVGIALLLYKKWKVNKVRLSK
jgi:Domain of unknown function (DUF4349)